MGRHGRIRPAAPVHGQAQETEPLDGERLSGSGRARQARGVSRGRRGGPRQLRCPSAATTAPFSYSELHATWLLRCAEAGAKKAVKASKAALAKRNAPCATKDQVFEVVSDGGDGSGLRLSAVVCTGDQRVHSRVHGSSDKRDRRRPQPTRPCRLTTAIGRAPATPAEDRPPRAAQGRNGPGSSQTSSSSSVGLLFSAVPWRCGPSRVTR